MAYHTFCVVSFILVLFGQCWWPKLDPAQIDSTITSGGGKELRVILLADTHLLGSRKGHWFDKLRREWQMYRAFQTAMTLHSPDVVFVLGDLFDEGLWCSDTEFTSYVQRFNTMFHVPNNTNIFVVAGNHDIGFHYSISPYLQERFSQAFNASSVRLVSMSGVHFVLINSMAMEGDGCHLCQSAEQQLNIISARLRCAKGIGRCAKSMRLNEYSRPIILQHFPLYRESDADCSEPDDAPEVEKKQKFRERWECLSRESSEMLLETLNPRVVVTGHTHHGCHQWHKETDTDEFTLPSFSWRNKDNPSFMMAVLSANNYVVSKCQMPCESTVIMLYVTGFVLILLSEAIAYYRRRHGKLLFKVQCYYATTHTKSCHNS